MIQRSEPMTAYLASPAVGSSTVREVHRNSEAHARYMLDNPRESEVFNLGAAIHCALLEPEKLTRDFSVRPDGIDGRTREGKKALAEWRASAEGKTLVPTRDAWETMRGATDGCYRNALACELLSVPAGRTEVSSYWRDPRTGLDCKARPDRIAPHPDGRLVRVDVKTMPAIDPLSVRRSVEKFGYHIQAAHWPDGADTQPFLIIAVEKSPPYGAAVYEITEWIMAGRPQRDEALARWARAVETGQYPGIPNAELECPAYLLPDLEGFDNAA